MTKTQLSSSNPTKQQEFIGYLTLLSVSVVWGWGFIAAKESLLSFTPMSTLFYRFLLATILTFILFHKRILNSDKSLMKKGGLIGLFQIAGLVLQMTGLNYTTTANQSFLCTCYPVFVPFVSWMILRKRPQLKAFVAGFIGIFGLAMISLTDSFSLGIGDLLSIGFAVIISFQMVFINKYMKEKSDPYALCFWEILFEFIAIALMCLLTGESLTAPFAPGVLTSKALFGVIYLGSFNTIYALAGQNLGQRYTKDTTASLVLSTESIFGLLCSVLYYHTPLSGRFLVGALMCIVAIGISVYDRKDRS